MIKWNRNFFGRAQGEYSSAKCDADCAQAQLSLTAAFDGESDGVALAAAQRHLEKCAHCAHQWEEWEKTRILLRSVPAPTPPSPLLAQVLLSCRLQSASELQTVENELAPAQGEELYSPLVAYLQATDEEQGVAPLARFIQVPAIPSHLHNQILDKTVRSQTPQRIALWPMVCDAFLGVNTSVGVPRVARWGMGLAVPALAAWLIFAGQTEYPGAPTVTAPPRSAAVPRAETENSARADRKKDSRIVRVLPAAPKATPIPKSPAIEPAVNDSAGLRVIAAPEPETNPAEVVPQVRRNSERASSLIVSVKKKAAMVRRVVVSSKKRAMPLVDIVENARPRLVNATFKPKSGRSNLTVIRQPAGRRHQISDPENAPGARLAQLNDLDFEEAFIAVTSQRDDRPEDLGRAFDEYRVSILAESIEEEDDLDDL